jgi:hypothetical protein
MTNREYVHKALEMFNSVFKYYVVELIKRTYGDEYLSVLASGPGRDKVMSNTESRYYFINH